MNRNSSLIVKEEKLLNNGLKTINYLYSSFLNKDLESARLEVQEILHVIEMLDQIEVRNVRRKKFEELVYTMKRKGIKIDFAKGIIS
ncbi:hypothetical protein [Litchfieldia salsa]|nr:hypothetical protein [Litchfieldia salsa]